MDLLWTQKTNRRVRAAQTHKPSREHRKLGSAFLIFGALFCFALGFYYDY
jgi:hypothetical protein